MPATCIEDGPDKGWMKWVQDESRQGRFAQTALKPILWREEGAQVRAKMASDVEHTNNGGVLHGGFLMSFADMALFAIAYKCLEKTHAVTVTCNFEFLGAGEPGVDVEAVGEVVQETGKTIFVRAVAYQGDRPVLNFSGTLRKIGLKVPAGDA
ncbi:MAG: PaaI family thioesterase [Sphingomonadales bacterium]|jgi:uncharacterized protein (TIGR00369 family)